MGGASAQMSFMTISRGQQSAIEEPREVVVRDAQKWADLWRLHAPGDPMPSVDFTKSMVVGVFLGTRNTGGYDVEITRIEPDAGGLVVAYRERRPDRDAMLAQILTFPHHLVRTDLRTGPVRFNQAP
jgi:hypothetical protein